MELKTLSIVRTIIRRNTAKHLFNNRVAKHDFDFFAIATGGVTDDDLNVIRDDDGNIIHDDDGN